MPKYAIIIIKYANGVKSLKAPFAIYLDIECLLKKKTISSKQPRKVIHREKSCS